MTGSIKAAFDNAFSAAPVGGDVEKSLARVVGVVVEQRMAAVESAQNSGVMAFATRVALFGWPNAPAVLPAKAEVLADSTLAYRGVYSNTTGGTGSSAWTKIAELRAEVIEATDAGAGTADAIKVISGATPADGAILSFAAFRANTSADVTVEVNETLTLDVQTAAGNAPSPGGISVGMLVLGRVDLTAGVLRLATDMASASIQAAAEAARDAAQGYAEAAAQADAGSGAAAARDEAVAAKNIAASAASTSLEAEDGAEAAAAISIAASGAAAAAAANAQSSARTFATWTGGLATATSTIDGQGAEVIDSDAGTHLQATATGYDGASVPNAGRYSYNLAWGRWVWIAGTGLSGKQTVEHVDTAETGWSYVIVDADKKVCFGVDLTGRSWLVPSADIQFLESNMPSTLLARALPAGIVTSSDMPAESGFVFAWTDAVNNVAWGVTSTGHFWAHFADDCVFPSTVIASLAAALLPSSTIVWWGDSLSSGAGGGGINPPAVLETALGRTVVGKGIASQDTKQIGARQGAVPITVTVSGDNIPASGGVSVTAKSVNILYNAGSYTGTSVGTLAGVPGTMSTDSSGNWTFTRTTAGSITACPAGTAFIPDDVAIYIGDTVIIWAGRNNDLSTRAARIAARDDILAMVKTLSPTIKRYLVLSVLNGLNEGTGSAAHTNILAMNAELALTFGDRYLDVRRYLIDHGLEDAGITPTSQDNTDVANDTVPASLRSDSIHLVAASYTLVGNLAARQIIARGW